jgi:hypothetical protein
MRRKNQDFQLEEIPGDQFPNIEAAQRAALHPAAQELAANMRRLLAAGRLVNDNNKITVPRS